MSDFYLGTHEPSWLEHADVPLFVSRRRLIRRKRMPRASTPWALDSGGFTELSMFGRWQTSPQQYAAEARRFRDEIGRMDWAAPQDSMCEPHMLKKTGLTVPEHQSRTIANYLELQSIAPDVPWIPVLQGWLEQDYLRHVEQYARAGVDLAAQQRVGIGTVCRRQDTGMVEAVVNQLARQGLRLHGFGVKMKGMARCSGALASADSMAWSLNARKNPTLPGCTHKSCANCVRYALTWRQKLLAEVGRARQQLTLPL